MNSKQAFIKMTNIKKIFGNVVASDDVNLSIESGEIHALLGENGAGKSTLINILSGVYTPDAGEIFIKGVKTKFSSPKDAIKAGVGTIYQHFKLVDALTARENILLGQKHGLFSSKKDTEKKINEIKEKFSITVDLDKYVADMTVGEKQYLEVLKVLYRGAELLILDEPTSVFTPQETEKLFEIMRNLKNQGKAVIFITHKMDEVMSICDKITVLRKGKTIETINKAETNSKELTDLMVGREVDLSIERIEMKPGKTMLCVKNLVVENDEKVEVLKNISFDIKAGEILGVAGIAGCGQKELCEVVSGIIKSKSGRIFFEDEDITDKNARYYIDKGISMSFIPEDRLGMGLVASMDMVDNVLLKSYYKNKGMLINRKPAVELSKELVKRLEIKTPSISYPIRYLSGGNIQKILLGRELSTSPKVLIMAYPVRGLDVNTCYTIYDLVNEEKKKGNAVLFVGEDLDVLMELADRIMVICAGEVSGTIKAEDATKEKLGLMMVGQRLEEEDKKID
ncbi:ABC transporter ATP-binding protein [Clostridium cellulovorans]|uniref:ABC transporter related n=1 Tax=Clostridium cellulovorans (strain ATCC 35296 / DSM 3052 / OCM 3 / 743B) TaxID=573061 RepID=D9SVL9_CLOC7|nr:ABC transporter ATP-binding protein [Clostridium cellulovorans]ADL51143.1 ABC transporter related [Clostridium cellulovorans 743B]